ncbi:MAG: selenocysteine-specific translation elongation factor [bacterium TMED264]|nr:MAG: selenocysteine-specific translation elongation factor [bacterium TMED264]
MAQVVIGTAGHIDHGKTSLVKSLTGTETDSLSEEKKRGMTIDLGFAYLNDSITIIDVPGHEKFIRNMTAGAANIHYGLIVLAADDGVMPQTLEHIDILNILGVKKVWIAITKIDVINDDEWIDLVELEIYEYLSNYNFEIFSCNRINNLSGDGIETLKNKIISSVDKNELNELNESLKYFRMNIDRSFIKKGFGTIVTGTVEQGRAAVGDSIEILPNGISTKIRGIQSHGKITQSMLKGDRAAVNLLNTKLKNFHRGSVIATPQTIKNSKMIVAEITIINTTPWVLKHRQRLRLHFGTDQILGRADIKNKKIFKKGQKGNILLLLESEVPVSLDDRFVIRSYSPMNTIGGGIVLDALADDHYPSINYFIDKIPLNPKERFYFLLDMNWEKPKTIYEWEKIFMRYHDKIDNWIREYNIQKSKTNILFTLESIERGKDKLKIFFKNFHLSNSLRIGVPIETIKSTIKWPQDFLKIILNKLMNEKYIKSENGVYSLKSFNTQSLTKLQIKQIDSIENFIKKSGLVPIQKKSIKNFKDYKYSQLINSIHFLKSKNKIADLGNDFFIHQDYLRVLLNYLRKYFIHSVELSIRDFKKISGLTRKTSIPLLEFMDKMKYTIRKNNFRIKGQNLYE